MTKQIKTLIATAIYFLVVSNIYAICSDRLPGVCDTWTGSKKTCKQYYEVYNGKQYKCKWKDDYNQCRRDGTSCH